MTLTESLETTTYKATMEVDAVEEGTVAKLLVPGGTEGVKVNAPIAILLEEDEDASALDSFSPQAGGSTPAGGDGETPETATPKSETPPSTSAIAPATSPRGRGEEGSRIKASPLAKRIAADAGLDLSAVTGSGPGGRIVKADVGICIAVNWKTTASSPFCPDNPTELVDLRRPLRTTFMHHSLLCCPNEPWVDSHIFENSHD